MKSKKIITILIVVIVLVIMALGGVVFAYATTDFLKTDEQLFCKYMEKEIAKLQSFKSEELNAYLAKSETTPYENEGKLSVNVEVPSIMKDNYSNLDIINNLNISFAGKTDKVNNKIEQDISINYSKDISFPISYKQNGNLYGITSSILLNRYLAIRNENLADLSEKLGSSQEVAGKIPTNIKINVQTIGQAIEKSKTIILENVTENNFSKIDNESFALTLNENEVTTILTKISEELKNSNIIPEISQKEIEEQVKELKTSNNEEFLKIIVNKAGNITVNIANTSMKIQIADSLITITETGDIKENDTVMTIQKIKSDNKLAYKVEYSMLDSERTNRAFIEVQYLDLTSQNVKEDYAFGLSVDADGEKISYEYKLDNTKKFVNNIEINEFIENDAVVLNDASVEYIGTLVTALMSKIEEINREQMQNLGVNEEQNPLIYATPIGYLNYQMTSMTQEIINKQREETDKVDEMINKIDGMVNNQVAETFNTKFLNYQGIQKGSSIKSLIQVVNNSNIANNEHIVSINGIVGGTELESYLLSIDNEQNYNVVVNIDSGTGYVSSINII